MRALIWEKEVSHMKKIVLIDEVTTSKRLYARVKTIGEMFDMDRSTVWKHLERLREKGLYDSIVIEENSRTKYINVEGFTNYMKSIHLEYLVR